MKPSEEEINLIWASAQTRSSKERITSVTDENETDKANEPPNPKIMSRKRKRKKSDRLSLSISSLLKHDIGVKMPTEYLDEISFGVTNTIKTRPVSTTNLKQYSCFSIDDIKILGAKQSLVNNLESTNANSESTIEALLSPSYKISKPSIFINRPYQTSNENLSDSDVSSICSTSKSLNVASNIRRSSSQPISLSEVALSLSSTVSNERPSQSASCIKNSSMEDSSHKKECSFDKHGFATEEFLKINATTWTAEVTCETDRVSTEKDETKSEIDTPSFVSDASTYLSNTCISDFNRFISGATTSAFVSHPSISYPNTVDLVSTSDSNMARFHDTPSSSNLSAESYETSKGYNYSRQNVDGRNNFGTFSSVFSTEKRVRFTESGAFKRLAASMSTIRKNTPGPKIVTFDIEQSKSFERAISHTQNSLRKIGGDTKVFKAQTPTRLERPDVFERLTSLSKSDRRREEQRRDSQDKKSTSAANPVFLRLLKPVPKKAESTRKISRNSRDTHNNSNAVFMRLLNQITAKSLPTRDVPIGSRLPETCEPSPAFLRLTAPRKVSYSPVQSPEPRVESEDVDLFLKSPAFRRLITPRKKKVPSDKAPPLSLLIRLAKINEHRNVFRSRASCDNLLKASKFAAEFAKRNRIRNQAVY